MYCWKFVSYYFYWTLFLKVIKDSYRVRVRINCLPTQKMSLHLYYNILITFCLRLRLNIELGHYVTRVQNFIEISLAVSTLDLNKLKIFIKYISSKYRNHLHGDLKSPQSSWQCRQHKRWLRSFRTRSAACWRRWWASEASTPAIGTLSLRSERFLPLELFLSPLHL